MPPNDKFYKYSFSGSDVENIAWYSIYRDGDIFTSSPVNLESLTTISISVHESKSPVRSLGMKSAKGYTSSIRTIGGSIIATVMNDHPLKALMDEYHFFNSKYGSWSFSLDNDRDGSGFVHGLDSNNRTNILPTVLPPFNIAFNAVTELTALAITGRDGVNIEPTIGQSVVPFTQLILFGVEFIDDGLVLSTNNPMSECTYTFVAQDYAVISEKSGLLGPKKITPFSADSEFAIPIALDQDRQAIWRESLNLKSKPGEGTLEYVRDENGEIVGISTHHDFEE